MRVILQRVSEAKVEVAGSAVGSISQGLMILVGFTAHDTREDLLWMIGKILRLRIFSDAEDKMNLSIVDVGGEILVVSQFTLFASTKKGNRPSFTHAARPEMARRNYDEFVDLLQQEFGKPVETGIFGEMMEVKISNHGPVTIAIDSKNKE